MRIITRRAGAACATALLSLAAGIVQAEPQSGWWWNPQQSGRGFSLEIQGDSMFVAGYLYESDGRATWLASAGPMQDAMSYQGRLSAYSNGQTLTGNYQPPAAPTDAGAVALQFSDDTHAVLTWPGGSVAIERFRFGSGAAPNVQPETGWWWNPAESGRGLFFEIQGNQMFTAGYMYDAAGHPVWYASAGMMDNAGHYQGRWDQYAHGQTMMGPYMMPGAPANAGSINAEFSAPDRATVTLGDAEGGAAAPSGGAKGTPKMVTLERYRFGKVTAPERPKYWTGAYRYTYETGSVGVVDYSKLVVTGSITWVNASLVEPFLVQLDGSVVYQILEGNSASDFSESVTTSSGACAGTSTASGTYNEPLFASEGNLRLDAHDNYTGSLFFPVTLPLHFVTPCGQSDSLRSIPVFVALDGKMVYLNMQGDRPDQGLIPGARITSSWSFSAGR